MYIIQNFEQPSIIPTNEDLSTFENVGYKELLINDGEYIYRTIDDITEIIIPLPDKIYICAEEVYSGVMELLEIGSNFISWLKSSKVDTAKEFILNSSCYIHKLFGQQMKTLENRL